MRSCRNSRSNMTSPTSPPQVGTLTDPFQILRNYYQALGGFEKFRSEITSYSAGNISIIGTGMQGQFRQWTRAPALKRTELEINAFRQISGDDGKRSWVVGANRKLIIFKDNTTIKRREIIALREVFKHLDPYSEHFEVRFAGVQQVNERSCYVLQISNKINDDVEIDFFDVNDYLLLQTIQVQPEQEKIIQFSDYREVDGVKHPFMQETEILPIGQKQVLQITEYQSNIRIDDSVFHPPEGVVRSYQFTGDQSEAELNFDFVDDHILTPVIIEGTSRRWLIDSSAVISAIDWEYAQELNLELDGNLAGTGEKNFDFSSATLTALQFKGMKFRKLRVAVTGVNQLFRRTLGIDIAGVLGYDFLSNFAVKVNYSAQKMTLSDPDHFKYTGNGNFVKAEFRGNIISVPMSVNGTYKGAWRLDIGCGRLSVFHSYAKENNLLETAGTEVVGFGFGSEATGRISQFDSLEIGGFKILNPYLHIHQKRTDESLTQFGIIGIFGNSLLKNFILFVDYKKHKLIMEKGRLFNCAEPHDLSGLQVLNSDDDNFSVQFVSPGSDADTAGFQTGDIIMSVNDINVELLAGLAAFRKLLRKADGFKYNFKVRRGAELLQLVMRFHGLPGSTDKPVESGE